MNSIQDKLMEQFQNMDNAYEDYARSKGLTYLSLMVLEEIYELGDGCTQKQIADDTHYPKQSVNLVVKAFLEDGVVELKELPENRKNKTGLSGRGKQKIPVSQHRYRDEKIRVTTLLRPGLTDPEPPWASSNVPAR